MEEYINFKFVLKSIWKKFYVVIFFMVVGFLVGYLYNESLPIKISYNATAKIYVKPDYSNQQDNSYDTLMSTDKIAQTYAELIKSRSVLEQVSNVLSFPLDAQSLMNRLVVVPPTNTPIIVIGITDENREHSVEIIEKVYTKFLEDHSDLGIKNAYIIDSCTVYTNETSLRSSKHAIMFTCAGAFAGIIIAYGVEVLGKSKKSH